MKNKKNTKIIFNFPNSTNCKIYDKLFSCKYFLGLFFSLPLSFALKNSFSLTFFPFDIEKVFSATENSLVQLYKEGNEAFGKGMKKKLKTWGIRVKICFLQSFSWELSFELYGSGGREKIETS